MKITEFGWDEGNSQLIVLGHGIEPAEAEEVFARTPLFRKTERGHYVAMGPTFDGRYLVLIFEMKGKGAARVITGWDMSDSEKRYYSKSKRGEKRMKKKMVLDETAEAKYYDKHGVLKEIIDEPVAMGLETELRRAIPSGKRRRNLKNISIKMDPLQVQAIKKVATMKSIPYQTLIRHWLSENLRRELHIE